MATNTSSVSSAWALQLAARVEKLEPPLVEDICAASARAVIDLLDDDRSQRDGPWHEAVATWNGARIRKLMRRARGAAWDRCHDVPGVTVQIGSAEVRAFVPGPMDAAPPELAKLQIQSSPLADPDRMDGLPTSPYPQVIVVVTPHTPMTWGKRGAQCAHAGQRAWEQLDVGQRAEWRANGSALSAVHASEALWDAVPGLPGAVPIRDGGFTEVPAGTLTAVGVYLPGR